MPDATATPALDSTHPRTTPVHPRRIGRQPPLRTRQPWLRSESPAERREVEVLAQIRREQRRREWQPEHALPAPVQALSHEVTKNTKTHEVLLSFRKFASCNFVIFASSWLVLRPFERRCRRSSPAARGRRGLPDAERGSPAPRRRRR